MLLYFMSITVQSFCKENFTVLCLISTKWLKSYNQPIAHAFQPNAHSLTPTEKEKLPAQLEHKIILLYKKTARLLPK